MTGPGRLIVICGLVGAGKTTLAKEIQAATGAIRLCPDEWIVALQADLYDQEFRTRLEQAQWAFAQQLLPLGHTVVIEWGVWSRAERDELRDGARGLGAAVELRFLDAPDDELWARIERRNLEPMWARQPITRDEFDQWRGWLEVPSAAELALFDPPLGS